MANKKIVFDMERDGIGTKTLLPLFARARVLAETEIALKLLQENPHETQEKEGNGPAKIEKQVDGAMNRADVQARNYKDPLGNKI